MVVNALILFALVLFRYWHRWLNSICMDRPAWEVSLQNYPVNYLDVFCIEGSPLAQNWNYCFPVSVGLRKCCGTYQYQLICSVLWDLDVVDVSGIVSYLLFRIGLFVIQCFRFLCSLRVLWRRQKLHKHHFMLSEWTQEQGYSQKKSLSLCNFRLPSIKSYSGHLFCVLLFFLAQSYKWVNLCMF